MKKKIFWSFLILLTILNLSAFGTLIFNNFFSSESQKISDEGGLVNLKSSLKLTENQYCKMQECQGCFKNTSTNLSKCIKKNRIELINSLKDENLDITKVNSLLSTIDSLQSKFLKEIVNNLLSHKAIMSQEQREKFFAMILDEFSLSNNKQSLIHQNQSN